MPNMSYCRFRNTERDLRDCRDNMEDPEVVDSGDTEEARARHALIRLCVEIAHDYGEEVG